MLPTTRCDGIIICWNNSIRFVFSREYSMLLEEALQEFQGVGEKFAKVLITRLKAAKIISNKRGNYTRDSAAKLLRHPAIFEDLPDATKVDLVENPIRKIPRDLIAVMDKELQRVWHGLDNVPRFVVAGSYIRGKAFSGDIDFVLCRTTRLSPEQTWDYFAQTVNSKSTILRILPPYARGSSKVDTLFEIKIPAALRTGDLRGKTSVKFWVNIFLTTPKEFIFAMLYAIGSGQFNLRMRALAKRKGFLLNQRGLYRRTSTGLEEVPIKKEEDIFKAIGMRYRPPSERLV